MSASPAYLRAVSLQRHQGNEGRVQELARHVAERIHEAVDVQLARPLGQQVVRRVEIDRRHHRDEVPHARRMQRRVAQRHRPALADAEEVHGFDAVRLAHAIDAGAEVAVHVVVERMMRILGAGIAPVDEVDIEPVREQSPDQRAVRLQVHHVRAVHERVADDERRESRGRRRALVTPEHHLVAPQHLGARRASLRAHVERCKLLRRERHAARELGHLLGHAGRIERKARHGDASPARSSTNAARSSAWASANSSRCAAAA